MRVVNIFKIVQTVLQSIFDHISCIISFSINGVLKAPLYNKVSAINNTAHYMRVVIIFKTVSNCVQLFPKCVGNIV